MFKKLLSAAAAVPGYGWPLVLLFFGSLPLLAIYGSGPVLGIAPRLFWGVAFFGTVAACVAILVWGLLTERKPKPPTTLNSILFLAAVPATWWAWAVVVVVLLALCGLLYSQYKEQQSLRQPGPLQERKPLYTLDTMKPYPQHSAHVAAYDETQRAKQEYYDYHRLNRI